MNSWYCYPEEHPDAGDWYGGETERDAARECALSWTCGGMSEVIVVTEAAEREDKCRWRVVLRIEVELVEATCSP
jgi:hypothetical protein